MYKKNEFLLNDYSENTADNKFKVLAENKEEVETDLLNSIQKNILLKELPLRHLLGINSFALAYGSIVATFGLIVLPIESNHFSKSNEALLLSFFLAIAGFSQLSGPIAGYFSDRCCHRFGRRRPFMISGCFFSILSLFFLWYCRKHSMLYLYILNFFVAMLGLNVIYVAFSGALSDLIPSSQMGQANGILGAFTVFGACLGFLAFSLFLTIDKCYFFFAIISILSVTLTCFFCNEIQITTAKPWKMKYVLKSYLLSPTKHRDFFLVFVARTFYYMAVSVQIFLLFYFRDMISDASNPKKATSYLALIGQFTGSFVCYPMGLLSDTYGRKPLIYFSSFVIIASYLFLIFTKTLHDVLVVGAFYGIGNGIYLSVDYALATDTLPSLKKSARFMGIWGVAAFLGTMIGPLLLGPLLVLLGKDSSLQFDYSNNKYGKQGYVAIMLASSVFMGLSVLFVIPIKNAK